MASHVGCIDRRLLHDTVKLANFEEEVDVAYFKILLK
jgi:hypothetical protein